jgi:hypothetical protein
LNKKKRKREGGEGGEGKRKEERRREEAMGSRSLSEFEVGVIATSKYVRQESNS